MSVFTNKNNGKIYRNGGKFHSLWMGLTLILLATCSCSRSDLQITPLVPTDLPPTSSPAPSETPSPTATFTPAPSATPIPTLIPSPTAVPIFLNPFSSLKPGQYLTYRISDTRADEHVLGVVSADGQDKFEFPKLLSDDSVPYLSPDHKIAISKNALAQSNTNEALTVINLRGEKQILLWGPNCYDVTWSPDGNQLVAVCNRVLYWFSLITGEKSKLPVECWQSCRSVKWSPDGKWIAFQTTMYVNNSAQDKNGIFLVNTACFAQPASCATSKVERVSQLPDPTPYAWSPDGKYLVISHNIRTATGDFSDDVVVLDLFNIQTRQVQRKLIIPGFGQGDIGALAWAPDGKWIAFNEIKGLYKVPIEGGDPVLVVDSLWPYIYQWITIPHPFAPGAKYTITPAGNGLNLRDQPSQAGKPIKILKPGDEITIVKGPTLADGYTWWQMRTKDGVEGWAEDLPDWYE
jgi:hypothetical protein